MKKKITLFLLTLSVSLTAQIQSKMPWSEKASKDNFSKKKTTTLEDYTANAEQYFGTIDQNAKGSGYKPFKRWESHWSNYLNDDRTIKSSKHLWEAWNVKNNMSRSNEENNGNWKPLGPYTNSNRYSSNTFKQTGGGRVNAIAIDPNDSNIIYVGAPAGGLWKSTDAGLNWTPLTDYLPQIGVSGIAIHPTDSNTIYIATGDDDAGDTYSDGVYKSSDGGTSWTKTGNIPGATTNLRTSEIYINPTSAETILVATSVGVCKSTDGGDNWTVVLSADIEDIKMKPNDPNIWYALSGTAFYKSTDGGDTFIEKKITALANSSRMTMDVTVANPEYVYIVSAGPYGEGSPFNGIYKSVNSGETFAKTAVTRDIFNSSQAWYDLAITVSSANPEIIYVGVLDIWKSTNGGTSFFKINDWANPNTASYTHADIHFLRFIDDKFYAGTDGGIYVSENEGLSFTDLSKNLSIHQFYRLSISPDKKDVIAAGAQDNGGYGLTDDNWYNYHGGDGMEGLVDINNPNVFYGFTQNGGTLNISNDGGLNRTFRLGRPDGEPAGNWITPLTMNSSGEVYAGYTQLFKLENNQWVNISEDAPFGGNLDHIEINPLDDNFILVSRSSRGLGRLFKSENKGADFASVPFFNGTIRSIEISKNDPNTVWIVTSRGVYKSENIKDASPIFENITFNLPGESKFVIKHHERSGNNTVYLGTSLGVYYTNDDLDNEWKTFDNNLPNTEVADLDINEEEAILYAATYGRGVFSSDIPYKRVKDLKILSVENPNSGSFIKEATFNPTVRVINKGIDDVTNITVEYSLNNGTTKTKNWVGTIGSDEEVDIDIIEENLEFGRYIMNVNMKLEGDVYPTNNNIDLEFYINKENTNPVAINSFENPDDNLLSNGTTWERGQVNKALLETPTGNNAYATKLVGNHPDQIIGYLYTNFYNLTEIDNPVLKFKMGFDIELDYDYMNIEYSTNRGNDWAILGNVNDPNWYNSGTVRTPQGGQLPGKQWTGEGENSNPLGGTNATIHNYSYDLSAFTNESEIMFRFVFVSDQATNEEGVVIDDLVIEGVLSNNDIELLNGISVSPNPSESIFNIQWQPDGEPMDLTIYDITGKKILSRKDIDSASFSIDMTKYTSGIYLLNMKSKGKSATKKLVLK